jgi:hypothetical protein
MSVNFKDLYNAIIKEGGATVDPVTLEDVKINAWAVGTGSERLTPLNNFKDFKGDLYGVLIEVVARNIEHRQYNPGAPERFAIGAWIDPEQPDIIVLEPVALIARTAAAIYWGLKYSQTSIYHLERKEVLNLDTVRDAVKRYA